MKTKLLIIFVITISSLLGYTQYVDARCSPNDDWPAAPCSGCSGCGPDLEQEKIEWIPYYDFKGKEFMESKLHQLQIAVNNNILQVWIENSPNPQEIKNVRYYYFLNGVMPDSNGMYFDQALEEENREKSWKIENIVFIDFSSVNIIGEPIQFVLEKSAYNNCNSYDAKITDENGKLVWGERVEALCESNPNPRLVTSSIKIGYNDDNTIIINESGKYFIEIKLGNNISNMTTKKEFIVTQHYSDVSTDIRLPAFDKAICVIDNIAYDCDMEGSQEMEQRRLNSKTFDTLKQQIENNIPSHEIDCRYENQYVFDRPNGKLACVEFSTGEKLGWKIVPDY